MKKLTAFFLIFILLFTAAACARSASGTAQTARGELRIAYDNALTGELMTYFQANQACTVTGVLLDAETDYEILAETAGVALVKDEAVIGALEAAGWTETEYWTDAQKKTNDGLFGFTVLNSPKITETAKTASKLLTDWLVGDGTYECTITTTSGSCSCKRTETKVTIKSDAPELAKSEQFKALVNP